MTKSKFGIQYYPLSKRIFVGLLNKEGNKFLEKEDITELAMKAVIDMALHKKREDEDEILTLEDITKNIEYEIDVTYHDLEEQNKE